jgi:TetR/AcrR family transcriptional regulator, regulator of cefoperazone and chloramphenicol sensitivity
MNGGSIPGQTGSYDSPIRREQAQLTRDRIVAAARAQFLEHGFTGTRLRDIAETAGVSEQTIYAVYKNKRGVLQAIVDGMDVAAGIEQAMRDLAEAEGDHLRQLAIFVSYDRRLFEREGQSLAILRDAATSDPDLASAYRQGRQRGHEAHVHFFQGWQRDGVLPEHLDPVTAADLYHSVSSLDSYEYLLGERGWSADRWEQETYRILVPALIRQSGS